MLQVQNPSQGALFQNLILDQPTSQIVPPSRTGHLGVSRSFHVRFLLPKLVLIISQTLLTRALTLLPAPVLAPPAPTISHAKHNH